jgi:hypothetical protein
LCRHDPEPDDPDMRVDVSAGRQPTRPPRQSPAVIDTLATHDWPRTEPPESPWLGPRTDGCWVELRPRTDWTLRDETDLKAIDPRRTIALAAGTRLRLVAFSPPMHSGNSCVWQMAWSAHLLVVLSGPHAGSAVMVEGADYSPLPRATFAPDPTTATICVGQRILTISAYLQDSVDT